MRHRLDLAWAASGMVAIAIGAAATATVFDAAQGRAPAVAAGVVTALVGVIATGSCEQAARLARGTSSRAWRMMEGGAAAFVVAGVLRAVAALGTTRPGRPLAADGPTAVGLLCFVAGALAFQAPEVRWSARRALLDGLLASSAVAFLAWITFLREGDSLERFSGNALVPLLFFPIADVVYCTAILTRRDGHGARHPGGAASSVTLLTVGSCLLAGHLMDLLSATGNNSALPATGVCIAAAMLSLALAGAVFDADPSLRRTIVRQSEGAGDVEGERAELSIARRHISAVVLPTAVMLIGVIGTAVVSSQRALARSSLVLLVLLGLLVLARRILLLFDNAALIDVLERRVEHRAAHAAERELYYRTLVQNASDALAVVGEHGRIVHASGNVRSVLGWTAEHLEGKRLLGIVHREERRMVLDAARAIRDDPGHTHLVECRLVGEDGQVRVVETTIANLLGDPLIKGLVCASRDVSERQMLEQERLVAAYTDYLTGLANRSMLLRALDTAIAESKRRGRIVGLVFMDLDGFKKINDTMGHQAGDLVLQEVANRISRAVRPGDLAARLGGDEFAVLLHELDDSSLLGTVTGRLTHMLAEPIEVDGRRVVVRASVGAALTGPLAATSSELLRNADLAMYSGKTRGKGRIEHFRPELLEALRERTELEGELRRAMEVDELELYFQPLIDLGTDSVRSLEALIRWHHPTRGMLMPGAFIPLAEESDLIIELDRWVLSHAFKALARLAVCPGGASLNIAANVSGRHLAGGELVNDIAGGLLETSVDAGHLTLEVTETVAFEETTEVVTTLQRLRKLGCKIAIDDFGTGSSSLSKLSRLPVDQLKLDGSFIREVTTSLPARAVIAAIVEMAKTLKVDLVAEGIETPGQLDEVRALGITIGQGFHLLRPAPLSDIEALLTERASLSAQTAPS
jgi:diguanylate cyclase (GGDEF)-like protein/PAS domain S-box-containing protein